MLKGRDIAFAMRSFAVGVGFGLVSVLAVGFYGDQNGLIVAKDEPEKMAAIEAQWTTQKAPASWDLLGFPNQDERKTHFAIKIPYALSLIATHSLTGTVEGVKDIVAHYKQRVQNGIKAYGALQHLVKYNGSAADKATYKKYEKDLGFAFLLKPYTQKIVDATPVQIEAAAYDGIPQVSTAFWSFRFMLGFWGICLLLIIAGAYYLYRGTLLDKRWYLRFILLAIPLPYLAAEAGWVLAEVGRQPWTVHEILPTFMSTSTLSVSTVAASLVGFVLLYVSLLCVELFLMFKYGRRGPSVLGKGRYHFEK